MATVDDFTALEDGWFFVSHFLGNSFAPIRMIIETKRDNWESKVSEIREKLIDKLQKIVKRMEANGHIEDSLKIAEICEMVQKSDLHDNEILDAILAKNLEYNQAAREMKAKIKEMFGH